MNSESRPPALSHEDTSRNGKALVLALAFTLRLLQEPSVFAQAMNPAYLREMPTVERVLSEMQASDPAETAARQMGALLQLKKIIEDMAGPRFYRRDQGLTPDETKLRQGYYTAYYRIQQSKDEYKKLTATRGYDVSAQFRNELFQKLFPPSFTAEYAKATGQAEAQFQAQHQARIQAENNAMMSARAADAAAQAEAKANFDANARARLDVTRCLSSGKSELECTVQTFGRAVTDLLGTVDPSIKKTPRAGLMLSGEYPGEGGFGLKFSDESISVACGELRPNGSAYTVEVKNNHVMIQIQNEPKPIVMEFRSDGRLAGPGPTDIKGFVIAGYTQQSYWAPGSPDGSVAGHSESRTVPILKPKTERCTIGILTSTGKPTPVTAPHSVLGIISTFKTIPPGLRMNGKYVGQGGLDIEFHAESTVLACGQIESEHTYMVPNTGNQVLVNLEDNGKPMVLTFGPDGKLAGSGPVQLRGRLLTGRKPNGDFTYEPRSVTCTLGLLAPVSGGSARQPPGPLEAVPGAAPTAVNLPRQPLVLTER